MKTLFIFCILLMPVMVFAQKMATPNIDKFTNDTTFFTTTEKIVVVKGTLSSSAKNIEAYGANTHGAVFLDFKVTIGTAFEPYFHFSKGNNIIMKLADNTLIYFSSNGDEETTRINDHWADVVVFNVIKADLKKISSSPITAIRIQADDHNLDFDITPQNSNVIKNMLTLMFAAK